VRVKVQLVEISKMYMTISWISSGEFKPPTNSGFGGAK
jgi:hypothetical protein